MAASLGDLIISIAGDIANLELSMSRAEKLTADTAKKIDSAMGKAEESIKELAAAYVGFEAIKGFADQIEDAQKYASSLVILNQTTGVGIETLSSYKLTAEKAGVSLQQVAGGLQVLEKNARDTAAGTGRARDAFAELGIKVTDTQGHLKSGEVLLQEVAKALTNTGNATLRVADTQKILQDPALLPFLSQLAGAGEREAEVTEHQALQAKAYQDALIELHDTKEKFYLMIAEQVTPVMTAFIQTLINGANSATGLNAKTKELQSQNALRQWAVDAGIAVAMVADGARYVWAGFQTIGDVVATVGVVVLETLKNIGTAIVDVYEGAKGFVEILAGVGAILAGNVTEGLEIIKSGWNDMGNAAGQFAQRVGETFTNIGTMADVAIERSKQRFKDFDQNGFAAGFVDQLAQVNDGLGKVATNTEGAGNVIKKVQKDAIDGMTVALTKQIAALKTNYDSLAKYGVAAHDVAQKEAEASLKEMERNGTLADHARKTGESVEATKARVLALAAEKDSLSEMIQLENNYIAALKANTQAAGASVQKIVDQIEAQRNQNATYGLSADLVTAYNITLLENKMAMAEQTEGGQDVAKMYQVQIDKLRELQGLQKSGEGIRAMIDGFKSLVDFAGVFAEKLTHGVGGAIQYLREQWKSFIAQVIATLAKQYLLSVVMGATGGQGVLGQAAGAAQNSISNTVVGAGLTAANEWGGSLIGASTFTGGASAALFGTSALTAGGDFVGTGLAGLAGNAVLAAGATDAFAASVAAAIPVIGWVVAIGLVLYSLFGNKGGGPKQQGAFAGTFDATGMTQTLNGPDLTQITGDNQGAATAQQLGTQIATGFYSTVASLGGTAGAMTFGVGYSQDPQGTAPGFFHGIVQNSAGETVYKDFNDDMPRDSQQYSQQASDSLKRMYLAALQTVDFGDYINHIMRDVGDISKLTSADIDAIIQKAEEAHAVIVGLESVDLKGLDIDALSAFQRQGESIGQTFQRVIGAWSNLEDAFTPAATKIDNAQTSLNQFSGTLLAAGYQMPKTKEEWLNVMRSIDLSTESGRTLWAQMMALAPAFDAVTSASQSMMDQFDQLMGKERPGYTTAQQQSTLSSDLSQFMAANGWTAGMSAQSVLEQLHTITRDDFSHYSLANQQLILAILSLDDTIKGNTTAVNTNTTAQTPSIDLTAYGSDAYNAAYSKYGSAFDTRFGATINGQPDRSSQITTQMGITKDYISELQGRQKAIEAQYNGLALPAEYYAIQQVINNLDASLGPLAKNLASVTILEAQYGKQKGDQLYDLDQWYAQQKSLVGGNQAALLALEEEYQTKRNAIVSGGTADGLTQTQKDIQSFLDSLLTDKTLSPLGLSDQMAVAAQHYHEVLSKAQGGDTDAQSELRNSATQYLQLARAMGASGPEYNTVFREVYDELAKYAKQPTYEEKMASAIPEGKLASQSDMVALRDSVDGLTTVIAAGLKVSDPKVQAALDALTAKISNGTGLFA
jgi:hypothetical protein